MALITTVPPIDASSTITRGMPLSGNFLIDHLSVGAYHPVMGRIVPSFTPFMRPGQAPALPTWQAAANLQMGVNNILESLFFGFGNSLILQSAWTPGSPGLQLNVQVDGYQNNMYGVANQIASLCMGARSLSFNYGTTAMAQIKYDAASVLTPGIDSITTVDLINNKIETGITAIRGMF